MSPRGASGPIDSILNRIGQEQQQYSVSHSSRRCIRRSIPSWYEDMLLRRRKSTLVLSSRTYRFIWWALVLLHLINGFYLGGVAALYWYFTTPFMAYFPPSLNLPSPLAMRLIAFTYLTLAVGHALSIIVSFASACRQRFCFPYASTFKATAIVPLPSSRGRTFLAASAHTTKQWWRDLFGIDGQYFDTTFELREAFEIGLQTYQAYYISKSISSIWINTLTVAAITINCFSTPFIQYLTVRQTVSVKANRMLCVIVDCILDFCNSVIIPLAIFTPYWRQFNTDTHLFPSELAYDAVWYINAVKENHQLFIVSPLDYVSTIFPHFTSLWNLTKIKKRVAEKSIEVAPAITIDREHVPSTYFREAISSRWILQLFTCCWGMIVVGTHLMARQNAQGLAGCRLHNNPWFVRNYACAVMELNCYRLNTSGSSQILSEQLAYIDKASLSVLQFTHCPDLTMPTLISTFPNLYGIEIYNSTISVWDDPSDLHGDTLHQFNYLLFTRLNFSDTGNLPIALRHPNLPPTLQDIEIANSNLCVLPDNIDELWSHVVSLYIEYCALVDVPSTLFQLVDLDDLSLVGNRIVKLPENTFNGPALLLYITLSNNPLTYIPQHISGQVFSRLQAISLEYTSVTDLPDWAWRWVTTREDVQLAMFGSLMCNQTMAGSSADMTDNLSPSRIICSTNEGTDGRSIPVDILDSLHGMS